MNLIVNPLAAIEPAENSENFLTGGPVPGRAMKFLEVSKTEYPRIHDLFTELSAVGLASLDIGSDLKDDEVELLREHGILIQPDEVPQRPLFSCPLDDVDAAHHEAGATLVVNDSFEFVPFDLTNFRPWMQDRHISPHNATVWLTDPDTGMRWGYWLTTEQAESVKLLEPGSDSLPEMPAELTGKLKATKVLVEPGKPGANKATISAAAEKFQRDRYAVISDLIPSAQLRALQRYYRQYVDQGFMRFGDRQVERRFVEYGEPVASMFHQSCLTLMTRLAGVEVRPTYCYSAVYAEDARLNPHTDREQCEYSFSFQLEYQPEPSDGISPWELYLSTRGPDDLEVDPSRDIAVYLPNGGFLAYKGRELVHYRTPLPKGHKSTSIFFHYVPDTFEGPTC